MDVPCFYATAVFAGLHCSFQVCDYFNDFPKQLMQPQANCCSVIESNLTEIDSNGGFIGS